MARACFALSCASSSNSDCRELSRPFARQTLRVTFVRFSSSVRKLCSGVPSWVQRVAFCRIACEPVPRVRCRRTAGKARPAHVPLHIVGQQAQEDVRAHPVCQAASRSTRNRNAAGIPAGPRPQPSGFGTAGRMTAIAPESALQDLEPDIRRARIAAGTMRDWLALQPPSRPFSPRAPGALPYGTAK